jgi:hypothetical protein
MSVVLVTAELEVASDRKKLMTTMHFGRSLGVVLPVLASLLAATLAHAQPGPSTLDDVTKSDSACRQIRLSIILRGDPIRS